MDSGHDPSQESNAATASSPDAAGSPDATRSTAGANSPGDEEDGSSTPQPPGTEAPPGTRSMETYYAFESSIRTGRNEKALGLIPKLVEDETTTGLWYAAFYGRDVLIPPLIEKLKKFGDIPTYVEENIMVNQSISVAAEKGMLGAIKLLMELISAKLETRNADEMTTLHCAAAHNHAETIRFCLAKGVKRDARDRHGNLALHLAARQLSEAAARELCIGAPKSELNAKNNAGFTPLDLAFKHCMLPVAEFLMLEKSGIANPGTIMDRDRTGMSALHLAALYGRPKIVKFLCDNKVPLKVLDANGNTALHIAARHNHEEIVCLLVDADIDLEVRNEQGNKALHIAQQNQFEGCADIIARASNRKLVSVYGVCTCEDITIGVGGAPGAGKTTFISSFTRSFLWYLFTNENRDDMDDQELSSRTRGIRIVRIKDPLGGPNMYHFLDFGGHQEYIPSHSLFISESTTPAMAICLVNATKSYETLVEQMELWCGVFISCHRLKEQKPDKEDESDSEENDGEDDDVDVDEKKATGGEDADSGVDDDGEQSQSTGAHSNPDLASAAAKDATEMTDCATGSDPQEEEDDSDDGETSRPKPRSPVKMPFLLLVSRADVVGTTYCTETVLRAYGRIVAKFRHRLAFEAEPIFLDARKSRRDGMREARQHIQQLSTHLLKTTDKTPRLVQAVRKVLPDVRKRIGEPFTNRETFRDKLLGALESQNTGSYIQEGVDRLLDEVLQLLSSCGEVVVFNPPTTTGHEEALHRELRELVVLRADWLLTTVVGNLCSPKTFPKIMVDFKQTDNARANRRQVEKVLGGCTPGRKGALVLKMLESIGICIVDGDSVILPSRLDVHHLDNESQIGLWKPDSSLTTYSGVYFKCDEGIPLSPGVAPLIQIRVYNQFRKQHDTTSYMWRNGIRVHPYHSEVQGTVVVAPSRLGVYIACRGPPDSQRHQYALIQILSKTVMSVVDRVSPGSKIFKLILSPKELKRLVDTKSVDFPRIHYKPRRVENDIVNRKTLITDEEMGVILAITDTLIDLLHLPEKHVHLMSVETRRKVVQQLAQPDQRCPQYKAWDYLAERLDFSRMEIERLATLPNPADEMLREWGNSGFERPIFELRRRSSEVNYEVARILEEEDRKAFCGEMNLFVDQRRWDLGRDQRLLQEERRRQERELRRAWRAEQEAKEVKEKASADAEKRKAGKRCVQFGIMPQVSVVTFEQPGSGDNDDDDDDQYEMERITSGAPEQSRPGDYSDDEGVGTPMGGDAEPVAHAAAAKSDSIDKTEDKAGVV